MSLVTGDKTGTIKDKTGTVGTKKGQQGQYKDKQGQNRDSHGKRKGKKIRNYSWLSWPSPAWFVPVFLWWFVPSCPCFVPVLSLLVPVLSLSLPACPCLSLSYGYFINHESSLSSPEHFELGQGHVGYCLHSSGYCVHQESFFSMAPRSCWLLLASLLLFHPSGIISFS